MKKIDWLVIVFIILTSIFALKDLFKPDFYTSHDGIHQVVRLYYFNQSLRDGQIPPRWAGGLLNGFGYPLFEFSYHLPWFIAEPFLFAGLSVFKSIKMTFLLGFIISGILMYFFQKEVFGRLAGLTGTVIYLFAPFRFSNIFVRAAIGDATIFIFPPLLFLSLFKLRRANKLKFNWIFLAAISLSGMLLSHAMVALFYFICFGFYLIYNFILNRNKKLFLTSSLFIILLTFGLSAYYFIPSFTERNLTRFKEIIGSSYMDKNFLKLSDLIYSSWGYGTVDAKEGAMSLQVGIAQWVSALAGLLLLIGLILKKTYMFLSSRAPPEAGSGGPDLVGIASPSDCNDSTYRETIFFLLIFILSILSMLSFSQPFWQVIKKIAVIDFPWRILSLTVFSSAILAGFVMSMVRTKILKFLAALFLITLAFYANRNHLRINKILDWPLDFYLILEKTTNSHDEYIPKWVNFNTDKKPSKKIEFSGEDAELDIEKEKSNEISFKIKTPFDGKVRINTVYYPGWEVLVNDQKKEINFDNGVIEFSLAKGDYKVVSKFSETPLRKVSNLLSLTTIGIIVLGFVKYLKLPRKFTSRKVQVFSLTR